METAAVVGAIVGAYIAIIGCYIFTFTLWCNLNASIVLQLRGLEDRLAAAGKLTNEKLDRVAEAVAEIKGRHASEN